MAHELAHTGGLLDPQGGVNGIMDWSTMTLKQDPIGEKIQKQKINLVQGGTRDLCLFDLHFSV